MFICALMLRYMQIYAYIGVLWLVFGLVLHHDSLILGRTMAHAPFFSMCSMLIYLKDAFNFVGIILQRR